MSAHDRTALSSHTHMLVIMQEYEHTHTCTTNMKHMPFMQWISAHTFTCKDVASSPTDMHAFWEEARLGPPLRSGGPNHLPPGYACFLHTNALRVRGQTLQTHGAALSPPLHGGLTRCQVSVTVVACRERWAGRGRLILLPNWVIHGHCDTVCENPLLLMLREAAQIPVVRREDDRGAPEEDGVREELRGGLRNEDTLSSLIRNAQLPRGPKPQTNPNQPPNQPRLCQRKHKNL